MTSHDPHRPGTPEGMSEGDLEQRAELASFLGKEVWPATGEQLQQVAADAGAPDAVRSRLSRLPAGTTFESIGQVWQELTGHREQHRF
jgi:hypothetical protein